MSLITRVAKRYQLLSEFSEALDAFGKGSSDPLRKFVEQVREMILPNGVPSDWFHALGKAKQNALLKTYNEGAPLLRALDRYDEDPGSQEPLHRRILAGASLWAKSLKTIELALSGGDEERVLRIYGFEVVPMPGVTKEKSTSAIETLKDAAERVKSKFPEVLYGKVFLTPTQHKDNIAWYVVPEDKLYICVNAKHTHGDTYKVLHELRHRYDRKFLDKGLRDRFWALSQTVREYVDFDEKTRRDVAEEILAMVKARRDHEPPKKPSDKCALWMADPRSPGFLAKTRILAQDYLAGKIEDKRFLRAVMGTKDLKVPGTALKRGLAVTTYGATDPEENFAEAFAHFCLGMKLPQELGEVMELL